MTSIYTWDTSNYKWWRECFIKLININMTNEFIFLKTFIGGSSHTHKDFILEIVDKILSNYNWKKRFAEY
jgi:hypothetical protein